MKAILVIILSFLFWPAQLFAQDHLSFMDVPIDSTVAYMQSALTKKGFSVIDKTNDNWMIGTYLGTKRCSIYIDSSSDSHVYAINVYIPYTKVAKGEELLSFYSQLLCQELDSTPIAEQWIDSLLIIGQHIWELPTGYVLINNESKARRKSIRIQFLDTENYLKKLEEDVIFWDPPIMSKRKLKIKRIMFSCRHPKLAQAQNLRKQKL